MRVFQVLIPALAGFVWTCSAQSEQGLATYSTSESKGSVTASGAVYKAHKLTAAHATYPMGTRLQVRRVDTGVTTQVLVEDRISAKSRHIIDLSFGAAEALGMVASGIAEVEITKMLEPFKDKFNGTAAIIASRLHGNQTASGETYDRNEFTAAHRTLPFGTRLKVYVRSTDQTTEVRINDRTAKDSKTIINLSSAAAKDLGIARSGTALVILRKLEPLPEGNTAAMGLPPSIVDEAVELRWAPNP